MLLKFECIKVQTHIRSFWLVSAHSGLFRLCIKPCIMCPSAWPTTKLLWWQPGGHIVLHVYYIHLGSLRKKELYWINRLNAWSPFALMLERFIKLTTESKEKKTFLEKKRIYIHIPMRTFLKSDIAVIKLIFWHLHYCYCYYHHHHHCK